MFQVQRILCLADPARPDTPFLTRARQIADTAGATLRAVPVGSSAWSQPEQLSTCGDLLVVPTLHDADMRTKAASLSIPVLAVGAPKKDVTGLLVPTDFSAASRRALTSARWLAALYGVPMRILHVMERPQYVALNATDLLSLSDATLQERTARRHLQTFLDGTPGPDFDADVLIEHGDAADRIADVLGDTGDLLVLSTHGTIARRHRPFGTVTDKLLRRLDRPVFLSRAFGRAVGDSISGDGFATGDALPKSWGNIVRTSTGQGSKRG